MSSASLLGAFEQHVLLAVARHRGAGYGMTVRRDIADRTGRDIAIGAVHATLERLETKGLVSSRLEDGDPQRRGRARRFFSIEAAGVEALVTALDQHRRMWQGLDPEALAAEVGS